MPLGVLATRQGDRDLGAKEAPVSPPIPSLIKYGAVSTKSVGGEGCVGKTQLPNVLVNIHKNTSVLLNPRQTVTTPPCTPCIPLLLILLSALNSFPQLLLPPSCVSELLPTTLAFHASLWYPFESSGPRCQLGCERYTLSQGCCVFSSWFLAHGEHGNYSTQELMGISERPGTSETFF